MHIALCDDNPDDLQYYANLISTLAQRENFNVELEQYQSGEQVLFHLSDCEKPVDILLLDIHMPNIDGIEIGLKLRQSPYQFSGIIIYVTSSAKYAIKAYDVKAFHYIVKGITPTKKIIHILTSAMQHAEKKQQEYILLRGIGEYRNIPIHSIQYFAVEQRIIAVHYGNNEEFEFYSTMEKLEITVMPKGFIRTHRSYIVSITHIQNFNSTYLTLTNGKTLPIGRKYLPNLKLALEAKNER